MPQKKPKYKKKMNSTMENNCATSSGQLQPKEIEQVAAILKSSDLVILMAHEKKQVFVMVNGLFAEWSAFDSFFSDPAEKGCNCKIVETGL